MQIGNLSDIQRICISGGMKSRPHDILLCYSTLVAIVKSPSCYFAVMEQKCLTLSLHNMFLMVWFVFLPVFILGQILLF